MRTLILSDVHANLTALNAVIEDAGSFERVWCLGDIVGYGPDPNQCIERIRELPGLQCVKGNHDAAAVGDITIQAFNDEAQASLAWLESELSQENKHWLAGLSERLEVEQVTLVHGSPRNPVWEYILDVRSARISMGMFKTQLCLVGHTHLPSMFVLEGSSPQSTQHYGLNAGKPFKINRKCILNPGSVGQPRDNDSRAAYLLYDNALDQWVFKRVPYDIRVVRDRILDAELPERHAYRLEKGW